MKKLFFIFAVSVFVFFPGKNFGQKLSPYAEISIITCDPGNELYSTFGHSAIRIKDPVLRIDNVYNYGTFDFNTPNFYLKFIRGQLDYMLSVSPYKYFILSYKQDKRGVKEQILDLSDIQKDKIYNILLINALPENKFYRYDFLKDNCSTRVLKIINEALGNGLKYPDKISDNNLTYRQMLMPYLEGKNWERFGINLALGRPVDKKVTTEESVFLPDYLYTFFEKTLIKTPSGEKSIVKKENILYKPENNNVSTSLFVTPERLFWLLLITILVLTLYEIKFNKFYFILDKILLFVFGFTGISILFLWFGTEHSSVVNNQNIIWASPLFIIAAFLHKKNEIKIYLRYFFIIWTLVVIAALIFDLFVSDLFDKATVPLILIIITRLGLYSIRK